MNVPLSMEIIMATVVPQFEVGFIVTMIIVFFMVIVFKVVDLTHDIEL